MDSDEQKIKDVITLWHERTAQGDVEAILRLMTDDATFLVAGQPPMTRQGAIREGSAWSSCPQQHQIDSSRRRSAGVG